MEFKRLREERNRLECLKNRNELTDEGLELIAEIDQALQLQQTGVSGSKCCRKCKECNKLVFDCSDFCSKRCETTYYR